MKFGSSKSIKEEKLTGKIENEIKMEAQKVLMAKRPTLAGYKVYFMIQ